MLKAEPSPSADGVSELAPPDCPWEIFLLGGLSARRGGLAVSRFRTRKTALLLAYLALHVRRDHAREELCELLWPDSGPEEGRSSLRMALSSLRRQMEPPGTPTGTVLRADRTHLSLNPAAAVCDVARFTDALRGADRAASEEERGRHLVEAADLYGGPLLPGVYEDWALAERDHLQEAHLGALLRLAALLGGRGDLGRALDYAGRAVVADPLREEAHRALIRLYLDAGQPAAARRQYDDLARRLREELGAEPVAETWALVQDLPLPAPRPARTKAAPIRRTAPDRSDPATPAPATSHSYGLPLALTRFFGREEAVRMVQEKLLAPAPRLVTLTGPGGAGKTRLAAEAAPQVGRALGGPVVFVPLAAVSDDARLARAVADALGLPWTAADPLDQVAEALSPTPALLVLDNMEQLGAGGARFVHALLERVPTLTCLATSRHRLGLEGEHEMPVLPLPTPGHPGTPERLLEFASVQLFADRAQAARPDFQVTRRNAEAVAALCHRLEGIPLALELAAGWSGALTPAQMLARLGRRFDLLVSRRQDASPRHRTLWATIDWSYRLLPADIQRFFMRLSVFRGGWTLEAAEAVCAEPRALELLADLRDRSLVSAEEGRAGEMRFRLLETLREFGAEQIAEEAREDLASSHAAYFSALAAETKSHLTGPDQVGWLDRLEADHDNLRAALDWYESPRGNADAGLRLAASLLRFWEVRGHSTEGRARLEALLARSGGDAGARAEALRGCASLAWRQSDFLRARHLCEEGLEIVRRVDLPAAAVGLFYVLAVVLLMTGEFAASRRCQEESLGLARRLGMQFETSRALNSLAILDFEDGDLEPARRLWEESLAIKSSLGDQSGVATILVNLAGLATTQGDLARARSLAEESVTLNREIGNVQHLANALSTLAELTWKCGDLDAARRLFAECLPLRQQVADHNGLAYTLESCAELASAQGASNHAARLLGASEALLKRLGDVLSPRQRKRADRLQDELRARLGAAYDTAAAQGAELDSEQAAALAVARLTEAVPDETGACLSGTAMITP